MKKSIDIEKLVQWAFREELPKKPYPISDFWARLIELGTRVDDSCTSDQPGFLSDTPPHPDALKVSHVVRTLEDVAVDIDLSRAALMGELACWLKDDQVTRLSLRFQTQALVTTHAIMATRPQWDVGEVRLVRVNGRNNKPVVCGITAGRRYAQGANSPLQLNIDPRTIANARGEYATWHAGLIKVRARLESWELTDFALTGPVAPPAPWLTGEIPKPRILQAI